MNADDFVGGHSILALERFMDETRHMIIFDVLSWKSPVGENGEPSAGRGLKCGISSEDN